MSAVVALSTTSSMEEARRIALELVSSRVAACVNIIPGITSVYSWKDALHEETEYLLLIKSERDRVDELRAKLLAVHSYEVAEFVVVDVAAISEPYAAWIAEAVKS